MAESLRLAMVTETFPPEINGVAMTTGRLLDGLRARGHRVQLIRPRQSQDPAVAAEPIIVPGLRLPLYPELQLGLPAARRLRALWRERRPDLVHIVTEGPLGHSALIAAGRFGLPVVAGFHTNFHRYSEHYRLGLLRQPILAYLRRFHNRCAANLVPTAALARELARLDIRRLRVLARGVDTQLYSPARRSEALRRHWGAGEHDPVALYVGRLAPEKNPGLLVDAFDAMRRIEPRIRLVLVGDGPARAQFETEWPGLVFCGPRTGTDLARHYASADCFLFPSLTETFGNVILEAMASGLAVVAFDEAAAHEHIEHGVDGLLAPPADTAAFVDLACRLAGDLLRMRGLGLRARQAVEPHDWNRIVDRLEQIYREVLATGDFHGRSSRNHPQHAGTSQ